MSKITNEILEELSEELVDTLLDSGLTITAAESCTGGLVASFITYVSGSSACFYGSFVTYSNEIKMKMLGVSVETLENHGAVSSECVEQMCKGAAERMDSDIAIAISGIAGPSGGTEQKPVGTVYIGVYFNGKDNKKSVVDRFNFEGDRQAVRLSSVYEAFKMVLSGLRCC